MAMQAAHVYYAQQLLLMHPRFDQPAFVAGTLFPDIRYLGVVKKEDTHLLANLDETTQADDTFTAGMLFHNWIDRQRGERVLKHEIHSLYPKVAYYDSVLKFYEDMLFYPEVGNWEQILQDYKRPIRQEYDFLQQTEAVRKWHKFVSDYLATSPTTASIKKFLDAIDFPADDFKEMELALEAMQAEPEVAARTYRVRDEIVSALKQEIRHG